MDNRIQTIDVTKEYVKHFNDRNLPALADLLDPVSVMFTRQAQPTIVGRKTILQRTKRLFNRLKQHGQTLKMFNAIIDLPETPAHPCMIGVLDGEKFSVCFLDVKANGKISNISILLNEDSVNMARSTEPDALAEAMVHEKIPERRELALRANGLRRKERKLKRRIQKEGHTHSLAVKMDRLQVAKKKLEILLGLKT